MLFRLYWLLLTISIFETSSSPIDNICPPNFHNQCTCYRGDYFDRKNQYIVNCSDIGFRDTSVLQRLPPHVEVLIFTGNNIPELPWNVFGTLNNLTFLRVVDMSNNKIREIKGKAYHHVSNVERLILNHNNLSIANNEHHPRMLSNFLNLLELHLTDAFEDSSPEDLAENLHDIFAKSDLKKLIKLHLEQNEIVHFKDRQLFCELDSLLDLHLGDNSMTGIDFHFECLPKLRFIDLQGNKIEGLTQEEMDTLDRVARRSGLMIDIHDNPFKENCDIFLEWVKHTNVRTRNEFLLPCPNLEYHDWRAVVMSERVTPEQVPMSSVGAAVIAVLIVVLVGFILAVVVANRTLIRQSLAPVMHNVTRKVHYTTIGKNDEPENEL